MANEVTPNVEPQPSETGTPSFEGCGSTFGVTSLAMASPLHSGPKPAPAREKDRA